ncbi:DUF1501 domain-containing protein [Pirellulales bacterium]|nr:DUF1501 domain-containing protein [Pirellulales bacterium]
MGIGGAAMAQLLGPELLAAADSDSGQAGPNSRFLKQLHHTPKAKRVIFLFQAGGPSQLDLFDYKPLLSQRQGEQLPESVRKGQRLTGMSGNQASLPLVGSPFQFEQHGQSGAWLSELLPHTATIADELCIVKSVYTEAINHGPGVTYLQTGSQLPGRPSIGSWLSYGLGTQNANLPSFVVMITKDKGGQPLQARLWGSGFLASQFEGVRFRAGKDPVLYLGNPAGIDKSNRRVMLDALGELHQLQLQQRPDPEIEARIAQYELGFRMQTSIPEIADMSDEPASVFEAYGPDSANPGTFASNCIMARRLAEQGVQFVQLYHQGWDQHGGLPGGIKTQTRETDQPTAALIKDLKSRGMLEDTLVVWGGEFGRTNYCQGKLTAGDFGRDHHPRCYTMWMAGGGCKPGISYGATDDYGYNVVENQVHIHDIQATLLHLLGIDHERLTYKHQGRKYRLTDVHGEVVKAILA